MFKRLRSIVICALIGVPLSSFGADFRPDLVDHSFAKACEKYLAATDEPSFGTALTPGRWAWQDRGLKKEFAHYRSFLPPEVSIVRPAIYSGDKNLRFTSELNYSEHGYVMIKLKDGKSKFKAFSGEVGKSSLKQDSFLLAIAQLLLEIGSTDQVDLVVVAHTHPHVNFTFDFGKNLIPNEFSDKDLGAANFLKYYFEAQGIFFPMQFEIIYAKITETENPDDASQIAKKALFYPLKMKTAIKDVPSFDEELISFLGEGWEFALEQPLKYRLERIVSRMGPP